MTESMNEYLCYFFKRHTLNHRTHVFQILQNQKRELQTTWEQLIKTRKGVENRIRKRKKGKNMEKSDSF